MSDIDIKVIEAAHNGCQESLSFVIEQAKPRVFTLLYRITLDYHLSEDLCQETMLNLIRSIHRLDFGREEALWAWLFRTAQGKVQHHRRRQATRHAEQTILSHSNGSSTTVVASGSGPATGLFRKEMIDSVVCAMEALKFEYRTVIVLRCMNEMSYAQIAAVLGGTQLRNKMLFFRAKRALRQELTKRGLGRSHFLGALVAFASVTSRHCPRATGAALVHVDLLHVSVAEIIWSAAVTRLGMAVAAGFVILGLITTGVVRRSEATPHPAIPDRYARLAPLLQEDDFAYPSSVIAALSPGGSGFMGLDGAQTRSRPIPVACADVLVGKPRHSDWRLILPEGHWVEVGFDGSIVDGPGPDLFYTGWYCPIIQVSLTGGAGDVYELPIVTCEGNCDCFHIVPFDISGLALSFEPRGIRVGGVGSWYRYQGFELASVRARIRRARP